MFKIRKGNTRVALILLSRLVIKFPRIRTDSIKKILDHKMSFKNKVIDLINHLYWVILKGIASNISEGVFCADFSDSRLFPFVAKTISLAFVNFQRYEGEVSPSHEEIQRIYDSLSDDLKVTLRESDVHEVSEKNWRKRKDGSLILIDFGFDPQRTPWAKVIKMGRKVFINATAPKV